MHNYGELEGHGWSRDTNNLEQVDVTYLGMEQKKSSQDS